MKKLLALVLALVLCLSVVACTKSNETKSDDTSKESTDVTENNTEDDSSDGSLVVETTPPADSDKDEDANTDDKKDEETVTDDPTPTVSSVESYVKLYGASFLEGFESGFTQSGLTCKSDIKAEGNGIIVTINIDQFENVDDATKQQMQSSYDSSSDSFNAAFEIIKTSAPDVEYLKLIICDKNGDVLSTVIADGTSSVPDEKPVSDDVSTPPATGFKRHEINGVTIDIPEKYTSSEVQGITLFYTDKYPTLTDNISIQFSNQRLTLANFSEEALKKDLDTSYGAIGATYEITGYEVYKTDGNDSVKCTLKTNLSGVEMIQTQYFIILDNGFFSSTFTDVSGEYTEEFKTIAESIKVK